MSQIKQLLLLHQQQNGVKTIARKLGMSKNTVAGKQLSYTDRLTGALIGCQVFVACLPFSDYTFAMVVPSQRLEDFLYALGCLPEPFGWSTQGNRA